MVFSLFTCQILANTPEEIVKKWSETNQNEWAKILRSQKKENLKQANTEISRPNAVSRVKWKSLKRIEAKLDDLSSQ